MPTGFSLKDALLRLAALEAEALTSINVSADAVPYFFHEQERMPFFTNRAGDLQVEGDSEELDIIRVTLVGRLYVAKLTDSVVKGEIERLLYEWIPVIIQYINERELLQSAAYPTALDYLVRCRVTACRGFTEFQPDGKIGTEITLLCEFEQEIEQAYY